MQLWEARLKSLTGLSLKDLQSKAIKEILDQLPQPLKTDPDLKKFLWKLSIYLFGTDKASQEHELLELWGRLKERYNLRV